MRPKFSPQQELPEGPSILSGLAQIALVCPGPTLGGWVAAGNWCAGEVPSPTADATFGGPPRDGDGKDVEVSGTAAPDSITREGS